MSGESSFSIKRLWTKIVGNSPTKNKKNPYETWTIQNQKKTNFFNEIQLLEGHDSFVKQLIVLDDKRVASASEDTTIYVWDTSTGQALCHLQGHSLPVTCLLYLGSNILVSGSADKAIRIWDLLSGACVNYIPSAHASSVKCLYRVPNTQNFCSGGNDINLNVWDHLGNKISTITRSESENLNCLLVTPHKMVLTASTTYICAYDLTTGEKKITLSGDHNDSIMHMIILNGLKLPSSHFNPIDKFFVSGSLDGAINIWKLDTLEGTEPLFAGQAMVRDDHKNYYQYRVNHLSRISDNYLGACQGQSFRVYNINAKECVLDVPYAHGSATVTGLIPIYGGSASDATIRLWGTKDGTRPPFAEVGQTLVRKSSRFGLNLREKVEPKLEGELACHSDEILFLTQLSPNTFISASYDGELIIWRDGRIESGKRDESATALLNEYNHNTPYLSRSSSESELKTSPRSIPSNKPGKLEFNSPDYAMLMANSPPQRVSLHSSSNGLPPLPSGEFLPTKAAPATVPTKKPPAYMVNWARSALKEKSRSEVEAELKREGNSDAMISAIMYEAM